MTDTDKSFNNACSVLWLLYRRFGDCNERMGDTVSLSVRPIENEPVFSFGWHTGSFRGQSRLIAEMLVECDPSELARQIGDSWLADRQCGVEK